jgi:flagellar biosynthesis protein FlhB|tara:strand:- start:1708 stop:1881 length:174 start_codon:yes stop_codon:yes gene_type:complete
MDFITSFFSWGEKPKKEIKEEIKISNGRDKLSKRFRISKPQVVREEIEEVDVEDVDA